jgi:hypothetical protein
METFTAMTVADRPFQLEYPQHDPIGTIRLMGMWQLDGTPTGGEPDTWVCEGYWVAGTLSTRWRCLNARDDQTVGETYSHRWLIGSPAVGAVAHTPAALAWEAHLAAQTPPVASPPEISPELREQVLALMETPVNGNLLRAIKLVRALGGRGLPECRAVVEEIGATGAVG